MENPNKDDFNEILPLMPNTRKDQNNFVASCYPCPPFREDY